MATLNRAALLTKLHKALRQQFKPLPDDQRPLMEQLLYAACLENTTYETADAAYAHLRQIYFDWNEIRVSTVIELAEVLKALPHAPAAAANIKRILQNIFESTYSFDLEALKKQNIGAGIQRLEKMEGTSPFIVSYVTQHALGGHSIPLDRAALALLKTVGVIDDGEAAAGKVTGLERTIPKNKGIEFGCLLHSAAAEFYHNVQSPEVKKTLLAVAPGLKDRWPKRSPKKDYELAEKAKEEAARKEAEEKELARQEALRKEAEAKREAEAKAAQAKIAKAERIEAAKQAKQAKFDQAKAKAEAPKPTEKHAEKHKARAHEAPSKHDKKPAAKAKPHVAAGKSSTKSGSSKSSSKSGKSHPPAKKKSATKQLSKRKPR